MSAMHAKKIKKRGIRRNFFLKLVLISITVTLFTIVAETGLLYRNFFDYADKDLESSQFHIIGQYSVLFEDLHQMANMTGNILLSSSDVLSALDGDEMAPYDTFALNNTVHSILMQTPTIHSISIINRQTNYSYCTLSMLRSIPARQAFIASDVQEYFDTENQVEYYKFNARTIYMAEGNHALRGEKVLSMVIPYQFENAVQNNPGRPRMSSGVIVNISADYFFNLINSSNDNGTNTLLVYNGRNMLCSSSDLDVQLLNGFSQFVPTSLNCPSGSQMITLNQKDFLMSHISEPSSVYTIVSFLDYGMMFYNTNSFKLNISMLGTAIFACMLPLIFLLVKKTYRPIGYIVSRIAEQYNEVDSGGYSGDEINYVQTKFSQMLRQIEESHREIKNTHPYIRRQLISNLLNGDLPSNYRQLMHEHFAAVANSAFFQVVVLLFDDAPTAEAIENEQFSSQVQKRLIAEKTVSQQLNGKNYIIFEGIRNEIAIICSFENASDCIEKNIAAQISLCLKENGIGATLCIGQSVNDISDIQKSYWAAHNLIKSRFIFGLSSVLDQQDEDALITSAFVIQNRLDKILKALTGCDRESLVSEINDIFDLLQNCCYDLAILVINTILYHIVETVDHLLKSESEGIENFNLNNIQTNLSRLQTLEESRNYLLTISLALTQKIEATRDNGKYALYLSIMEYIEHNIGRHDLSLNLIGEQFNLSAGYASKIFNSLHHTGITEFISQLRVESAKKLLTDTNKTISQISKEIGFQSSAYFITIFKKHVGSTPNVYRKTTKNTFLPP